MIYMPTCTLQIKQVRTRALHKYSTLVVLRRLISLSQSVKMQNDPHKQGYNNYGNAYVNQYPPVNPSPYGAGGVYPYVTF